MAHSMIPAMNQVLRVSSDNTLTPAIRQQARDVEQRLLDLHRALAEHQQRIERQAAADREWWRDHIPARRVTGTAGTGTAGRPGMLWRDLP